MSYTLVKSVFAVALFVAGAGHADSVAQTPDVTPAASHYASCSDNTAFVSAYCAELHRAEMVQMQTCMAQAPATSQGYRARYLLCRAEVAPDAARLGG